MKLLPLTPPRIAVHALHALKSNFLAASPREAKIQNNVLYCFGHTWLCSCLCFSTLQHYVVIVFLHLFYEFMVYKDF